VNLRKFLTELKRRHVYKVAIAYGVVAWLLMQVASQIFPFFEIPNWAVRLVVLLLIIGFPVALILAWAFELTPEGLKRTAVAGATPAPRSRSRAWIYVVLIAGALSAGLFFLGRFTASTKQSVSAEVSSKSIAVLPFENLSRDPDNAYFATGIQDEILTRIAKIGAHFGQKDLAISILIHLLTIPYRHPITPAWLRLDPDFDPLRGDPRFEEIVASLVPEKR